MQLLSVVDINTLDVSAGRLPRADGICRLRHRRKVIRWASKRQSELTQNWERIERKQTLERIGP